MEEQLMKIHLAARMETAIKSLDWDAIRHIRASDNNSFVEEIPPFDAMSLNDYGGGDVSWWHQYIRSLLKKADVYYRDEFKETIT